MLTVGGTLAAAMISILAFGREIEPYMAATRGYVRQISDNYAVQLESINKRLLSNAIDDAIRELTAYQLKAKDDPDPLVVTRIRQLEDSIRAMQEELRRGP